MLKKRKVNFVDFYEIITQVIASKISKTAAVEVINGLDIVDANNANVDKNADATIFVYPHFFVSTNEAGGTSCKIADELNELVRQRVHFNKNQLFADNIEQQLTPAEKRIVILVASGLQNKEIAVRCGVKKRTIDSHITKMLQKTQTENRVHLVVWALYKGIINIEEFKKV
jgi:DNA-binding CsgD family transcriptional regulator